MKLILVILFYTILISSCNSNKSIANLKPKLELLNNQSFSWEKNDYNLKQIDSILFKYKSTVELSLLDSIRIELIVNVDKVNMGTLGVIKNSLRKNNLTKITYKIKNNER